MLATIAWYEKSSYNHVDNITEWSRWSYPLLQMKYSTFFRHTGIWYLLFCSSSLLLKCTRSVFLKIERFLSSSLGQMFFLFAGQVVSESYIQVHRNYIYPSSLWWVGTTTSPTHTTNTLHEEKVVTSSLNMKLFKSFLNKHSLYIKD